MADMNTTATVTTKVNGEQAENELKKLQGEADILRQAIAKAYTAGDTKHLKQLEKDLRANQKSARALQASMFDVNKVLSNLKTSSVKDLNKALRTLTSELNSGRIARGSKEWDAHIAKIKALKTELAGVQAQQQATTTGWQRMINGFNKYGAAAASAVAAITGISFAINQMNQKAREKEDSAANLKALTGLDDNSIKWLTDQATALSTNMMENGVRIRKSATEILEAYKLVGSAKPELLKNKEALNEVTIQTMTLAEASGMNLVEAVDGVTLAMNQYSASADQAARFSNVMAAGAQAGSAEVASVTAALRKSGVVMSQSNVTIEETVGLIETLSEFGIKDEIAGTGMKTFFLKLAGGADETNPKIVGVTKALENLAAQNLSAAEIQKRFGLEAYNVASILIQNTDKINHYTKAVTDTNQAVEQAAVNSATAQAKMSQMKNEMQEAGIAIAQELSPYVLRLGNTFTNSVKVLTVLIKFLKEYGSVIISTGAALAGYTIAVKASTIASKALDFWNDKLSVSFAKIGKLLKDNPWGVAIVGITAIASAVAAWYKNQSKALDVTRETNKLLKSADKEYYSQKAKIAQLSEAVNNEVLSLNARKKALAELKQIVPGYNAQLTEEGKLINNNTTALQSYLAELKKEIRFKAVKEKLEQLYADELEQEDAVAAAEAIQGNAVKSYIPGTPRAGLAGDIAAEKLALKTAQDKLSATRALIQKLTEKMNGTGYNPVAGTTTSAGGATTATSPEKAIEDTFQKELDVIKANLVKRTNALRESRNDDLITEEDFNAAVIALNIESMQEQMNLIKKKYGEDSVEYQNALAKFLDVQEDFNKLSEKCDDDARKTKEQKEEELQKKLAALRKKYGIEDNQALMNAELAQLDSLYGQKLIKEEEYQQLKKSIIDKYNAADNSGNLFPNGIFGGKDNQKQIVDAAFKTFNDITSGISNLFNAQQAEEMAAIDKKYAREIELAGDNQGKITAIEKKKEAEKARIQSQYADRQFAIQIAQALSSAAMSIIQCFAQLGPIAGAITAVGVGATTALQIAAMNKQRQAAKQFWTGGFTPDGAWDEYQGNVHSNEFVANRHAVGNPNVRRVLNVIDKAQQNNTIATMSAQDVSDSLNASGVTTAAAVGSISASPENIALTQATAQLAAVLAKGIVANVSIEGPRGFAEVWEEYQKNQQNKTF